MEDHLSEDVNVDWSKLNFNDLLVTPDSKIMSKNSVSLNVGTSEAKLLKIIDRKNPIFGELTKTVSKKI